MAEVVKGIIDVDINTGNAAAELKILQQRINSVFLSLNKGNATAAAAAKSFSSDLLEAINSSRVFTAEQVKMRTAAGALDDTLRKGQATLGQYFSAKYVKNGALFAETLDLSRKRASLLQTQFIALGKSSRGMQDAIAIRPLQAFANQLDIASQRSQILSSMFRQGTTQLINFGKNVQWAGRQLMVGFTVPLTIFGTTAGRVFKDLEMQVVSFKKVYGDLFTTPRELQENLDAVQDLAREYTKYGVAVKDTIGLAAQAAAAGRRNSELTDAVTQATRLGTLGQMDQNQALETTIALQSAFKLSGQELADTINFLNMVENQTVVSLQDLSAAIPRVAPVIQGLGGDVKDMAVFLAAMQEGGVSAEQGANALKSGLASLINPTKQAKEMLAELNINLDSIIQTNRGDLMGTVMDFGKALQTLDEFSRQQALEQVFGKFQYARLGALFENIVRDGSQASQVMDTMAYSSQELAMTAEKELSTIEQAFSVQLTSAIEKFKLAIAPIGEIFVRLAIPIVNFATRIAEAFNNLPDFQKKFIAFATIITGLVIPAGTMFFGLLMNLTGTLARIIQFMGAFGRGFAQGGIVGAFRNATQSAKYFSNAEIEASLAAQQLGTATEFTNSALREQITQAMGTAGAINYLSDSYTILIQKMAEAAGLAPYTMQVGQRASGLAATGRSATGRLIRPPQRRNAGGPIFMSNGSTVPGTGNTDKVPAMLTPGEFVVNKEATKNNLGLLHAINNSVLKMQKGGVAFNTGPSIASRLAPQAANEMAALSTFLGLASRKRFGVGVDLLTGKSVASQQRSSAGALALAQKYATKEITAEQILNNSLAFSKVGYATQTSVKKYVADSGLKKAQLHRTHVLSSKKSKFLQLPGQSLAYLTWRGKSDGFVKMHGLEDRVKPVPNSPYSMVVLTPQELATIQEGAYLPNAVMRHRASLNMRAKRSGKKPPTGQEWLDDISKNKSEGLRTIRRQAQSVLGKDAGTLFADDFYARYTSKLGGKANIPINDDDLSIITREILAEMRKGLNPRDPKASLIRKLRNPSGAFRPSDKGNKFYTKTLAVVDENGNIVDSLHYQLFNKGNIVPGTGNTDTVPAMLTPGEFVVNKEATKQNLNLLHSINNGKMAGYNKGGKIKGMQYFALNEPNRIVMPMTDLGLNLGQQGPTSAYPRQSAASRFGGMLKGGGGMGLMSLGFILPMIALPMQQASNQFVKKIGDFIGMISPIVLGLSLVGPMIPKLAAAIGMATGPFAAIAVGIGLLGFTIVQVRKNMDKLARESAKQGAASGGAANAINEMAAIVGKTTPLQTQLASQIKFTDEQLKKQEESLASLQTEQGQAFVERLQKLDSNKRVQELSSYLQQAIASGLIGQSSAQEFARAVGTTLGDTLLGPQVIRQISGQRTGSRALLGLTERRTQIGYRDIPQGNRVVSRAGVTNVTNSSAQISAASFNIGMATQIYSDAAQVQALASQELEKGTITQREYNSTIEEATRLQKEAVAAIDLATKGGVDTGILNQAFTESLKISGKTQDQIDAINKSIGDITGAGAGITKGQLQVQIASNQIRAEDLPYLFQFLGSDVGQKQLNFITSFEGQNLEAAKFAMWASNNLTETGQARFKLALQAAGLESAPGIQQLIAMFGEDSAVVRQLFIDVKTDSQNADQIIADYNYFVKELPPSIDKELFFRINGADREAVDEVNKNYDKLLSSDPKVSKQALINIAVSMGGEPSSIDAAISKIKNFNELPIENKVGVIAIITKMQDLAPTEQPQIRAQRMQEYQSQIDELTQSFKNLADESGGASKELSAFEQMQKSLKEIIEYRKIVLSLNKQGVSMENIAIVDQNALLETNGKKRKKLIDMAVKQSKIQEQLKYLFMTEAEFQDLLARKQEKSANRQLELIDRRIDKKQDEISNYQDSINLIQKENEYLNRGLDVIADKEDAINKQYDLRLEALDKISTANEREANRQRSRISLVTALASGDIAAAAKARQEITQAESGYAIEDARRALENKRNQELKQVTASVNGQLLTRDQIQKQLKANEESIFALDEKIYSVQLQIKNIESERIPIQQELIRLADERHQREMANLESEIAKAQEYRSILTGSSVPITSQSTTQKNTSDNKSTGGSSGGSTGGSSNTTNIPKVTSTTLAAAAKKQSSTITLRKTGVTIAPSANDLASARYTAMAAAYYRGTQLRYFGGLMKGSNEPPPALKMAYGSLVPGLGNSDRVPALLTPGEFVIRKSVASAYMPLLESINSQTYPGIKPNSYAQNSSNMYNTYSINVNVAGTNASPDDIANAVMSKIKAIESRSIRSVKVV